MEGLLPCSSCRGASSCPAQPLPAPSSLVRNRRNSLTPESVTGASGHPLAPPVPYHAEASARKAAAV